MASHLEKCVESPSPHRFVGRVALRRHARMAAIWLTSRAATLARISSVVPRQPYARSSCSIRSHRRPRSVNPSRVTISGACSGVQEKATQARSATRSTGPALSQSMRPTGPVVDQTVLYGAGSPSPTMSPGLQRPPSRHRAPSGGDEVGDRCVVVATSDQLHPARATSPEPNRVAVAVLDVVSRRWLSTLVSAEETATSRGLLHVSEPRGTLERHDRARNVRRPGPHQGNRVYCR